MSVHPPPDGSLPRGRQQFRLQPIHNGGYPQQQQQPRSYDPAYYDYRYAQPYPYHAYPSYQNYGMVNTYTASYPPQQPEPYVSENDGYVINGVWYPCQQPYNIPQDSQARGQRANGRRTGYPGYPADLRHGGMPDGYGGVVYGKNRGPPDPYQQPDVPILDRVRKQLEWYFSAKNLTHDEFLRGLMRPDGYVPFSLLMEFPRMKAHKISPGLAVRAAKESPHLKVMGIDYPLQQGRARDYFIRTKHSWWNWVQNPDDIPEEEKIEDDDEDLLVRDMTELPQRHKESLWPDDHEDTKVDGSDSVDQLQNSRVSSKAEEDTMRGGE